MKRLFTRIVRLTLLALILLMAIPARAATFDTSKVYYISANDCSWYENSGGVPLIYGCMNGETANKISEGTRLFAFVPNVSNQSTAYIKRKESSGWEGQQVDVSLSSSSNNIIYITDPDNQSGGGYAGTITDTWEVMVAKKGSSTYTSYSVSGSTSLTSAEFTIENGDHFYLKHTVGSLATVKHYKNSADMSLATSSSSKYDYMPSSGSSDVSWTGNTSKIKLYFQYSGENPYNIYCSGSEVATAPSAPTIDWDMQSNTVTMSGSGEIRYTTDGEDPKDVSSYETYSSAITLKEGEKYTITARAYNNGLWSETATIKTVRYLYPFDENVTYYVKLFDDFNKEGNRVLRVSFWGGDEVACEQVSGNIYKFTTPSGYKQNGITLKRSDSSNSEQKNYVNLVKQDLGNNFGIILTGYDSSDGLQMTYTPTEDTWQVMVAKNGASEYTTYSTSVSASDATQYTSEEFTIESGDHFYLLHNVGDLTTVKHKKNDSDLTIDNTSDKKLDYMPSSGSDDVSWTGSKYKLKLVFNFKGDNPYGIYYDGSVVKEAPSKPEIKCEDNKVTITSTGTVTAIYYTTNETEPSKSNGTLYSGPFPIEETVTVKAIAYNEDLMSDVETQTATYVKKYYFETGKTYYVDVTNAAELQSEYPYVYDDHTDIAATVVKVGKLYSFKVSQTTEKVYVKDNKDKTYEVAVMASEDAANDLITVTQTSSGNYTYTWGVYKPQCEKPTLEVKNYSTVYLSCDTEGAEIYYTLDGKTDPTQEKTDKCFKYEDAFEIGATTEVRAIAYKSGYVASEMMTETATYTPKYRYCSNKYTSEWGYKNGTDFVYDPANKKWSLTVESGSTSDYFSVYRADGKQFGAKSAAVESDCTLTFEIIGDSAPHFAVAQEGITISFTETEDGNLSVSFSGIHGLVATPEIKANENKVTITCATADAKIYYTKDGSEPTATESNTCFLYKEPFTVEVGETTIKAIAVKEGNNDSKIKTEKVTYTAPYSFYVQNDGNWSNVYMWLWEDKGENVFTDDICKYPGPDVLAYDNNITVNKYCQVVEGYIGYNTVYKVTVSAGVNMSKWNSDLEETNSTGDLEIVKNCIFSTSSKKFVDKDVSDTWKEGTAPVKVADPTIKQTTDSDEITMECGTADAVIYYTTDGETEPTEAVSDKCFKYEGSFYITKDCTIKAKAFKDGADASEVVELVAKYLNEFVKDKTYYIDSRAAGNWQNNGSYPLIYGVGNGIAGTVIVQGKYYSFEPTLDHQTKAYVQRQDGDWNSKQKADSELVVSAPDNADNDMIIFGECKDAEVTAYTWGKYNPQCEKPTLKVEGYSTVYLSCDTEGAEIYYTLDGKTTPTQTVTEKCFKYEGAFEIGATTEVRAIAFKSGYVASDMMTETATYTPKYKYVSNKYNGTEWSFDKGTEFVYDPANKKWSLTVESGSTSDYFSVYRADGKQFGAKSAAVESDCTLTFEIIDSGAPHFAVAQEGITISFTEADNGNLSVSFSGIHGLVATPEIKANENKVTITCATDDATIYYTTDGETTPSAAVSDKCFKYDGEFTIPVGETTIQAIAVKEGNNDSKIAKETFTYVEPYSFYVQNDGNWSNVYMWLWKDGGENGDANVNVFGDGTNWPGANVLKYDESKVVNYTCSVVKGYVGTKTVVYKVTVSGAVDRAVFCADGSDDDQTKTGDLEKFSGQLFKTGSKSFSDFSDEWKEGEPVFAQGTYYVNTNTCSSDDDGFYSNGATLKVLLNDKSVDTVKAYDGIYSFVITSNDVTSVTVQRVKDAEVWGSSVMGVPDEGLDEIDIQVNGATNGGDLKAVWAKFVRPSASAPTIKQSTNSNKITLECGTADAVIYYTTDGETEPTENSTKYEGPFYIAEDCTIKAIAFKDGIDASAVVELEAKYVKEFAKDKTYYVDASEVKYWFNNSVSVPVVYYEGGNVRGTRVVTGKYYYSFTLPEDHVTTIYIQRGVTNDSWESGEGLQVVMSAPTDESDMVIFGKSDTEAYTGTWGTYSYEPEKWEVMVWDASAEEYQATPVSVTAVSSTGIYTLVSDEFNIGANGHFYLKHTAENDGEVTMYGNHDDGTSMSENNNSAATKVDYFGKQDAITTENDVTWTGSATSVMLHFKYDGVKKENPYELYVTYADAYYLLGDLNRWLSDKTYTVGDKEYDMGYDYIQYGLRDDYKFTVCKKVPSTATKDDYASELSGKNEASNWYELKIPTVSKMGDKLDGRLYGQFTIYKGSFNEHNNGETDVIYYSPTWKEGSFSQWSWNAVQQDACYEKYELGLDRDAIMKVYKGENKNIQLAHNFFSNATLYFNPEAECIILETESDADVKDIKIYYARSKYEDPNVGYAGVVAPTITINTESMNNNNYTLNVTPSNREMEFITTPETINGVEYSKHWELPIVPGMENPAGQKLTLSISGAEDYDSSNSWATIENDNVYLADEVNIFLNTSSMTYDDKALNVTDVKCRVYGYSKDGTHMQVYDRASGQFVDDSANGKNGWEQMTRGNFDGVSIGAYDLSFGGKWSDSDQGTAWSSYSEDSSKAFSVSPMNANKFVQYKITGTVASSQQARRKAESSSESEVTVYIPSDFFSYRPTTISTSDEDQSAYMYVLNGQNKVVNVTTGFETGIDDLFEDEYLDDDVEDVEVETIYYNLQGQRIKNPDHGFYIRIRGNRADKVVL